MAPQQLSPISELAATLVVRTAQRCVADCAAPEQHGANSASSALLGILSAALARYSQCKGIEAAERLIPFTRITGHPPTIDRAVKESAQETTFQLFAALEKERGRPEGVIFRTNPTLVYAVVAEHARDRLVALIGPAATTYLVEEQMHRICRMLAKLHLTIQGSSTDDE